MTSKIRQVTVDCADAYRLANFWAQVLDGAIADGDEPGDSEVLVETTGRAVLFIEVPEGKTSKNRLHLDLEPIDRSRDEEVQRLVALGATVFGDHRESDGTGWVTLADIEGNEFCVERSADERAASR